MILDVTNIELIPGKHGKDCKGNGKHFYENGEPIECCCDECDYAVCCYFMNEFTWCELCEDTSCPLYKQRFKPKMILKIKKTHHHG